MLGVSLFIFFHKKLNGKFTFPYRAALVIVSISYLLSLSTTLTVGSIKFKPFTPYIVDYVLSAFRASGRFFWLGSFWLLLIGLATLAFTINFKKSILLLLALLLIQIVDTSGIALDVRKKISTIQRASIESNAITSAPNKYDEIVVLPPWQCDTEKTAGGGNNYEYLGFFAADHKMSTNNFYAARILPAQTIYHCSKEMNQPSFLINKIYIISADFFEHLKADEKEKLNCSYNKQHTFYVCTVN